MALTAEQLKVRKLGIGSSEIATIVGLGYHGTSQLDVWLAKMGLDERTGSDQSELGDVLEPVIAGLAARRLGVELAKGSTVVHREVPLAVATPDFLEYSPGVLVPTADMEIKNVGHRMIHHWDPDVDDDTGPPAYVLCQVQWQMEVIGIDQAHVAALLGGRDLRIYTVERDRSVGEWLIDAAVTWWRSYVDTKTPPPIDGSKTAERFLRRLHPRSNGTWLQAHGTLETEIQELRALKAQEGDVARRLKAARNRLCSRIGDALGVLWTDEEGKEHRIKWGERRGNVSWKGVAAELGATANVAEKHRGATIRELRLPRGWGAADDEDEET